MSEDGTGRPQDSAKGCLLWLSCVVVGLLVSGVFLAVTSLLSIGLLWGAYGDGDGGASMANVIGVGLGVVLALMWLGFGAVTQSAVQARRAGTSPWWVQAVIAAIGIATILPLAQFPWPYVAAMVAPLLLGAYLATRMSSEPPDLTPDALEEPRNDDPSRI